MEFILPKSAITEGEYREEELVQSVVDYVNELTMGLYKWDEMPTAAVDIYNVDYYRCQVENGGISQFVWNSNWKTKINDRIENGLTSIGAGEHLALFKQVRQDVKDLGEELQTFLRTYYDASSTAGVKLDSRTHQHLGLDESILSLTYEYIRNHPEVTFVDDGNYAELMQGWVDTNPAKADRQAELEEENRKRLERLYESPMVRAAAALCEKVGDSLPTPDHVVPSGYKRLNSADYMALAVNGKKDKYHMLMFDLNAVLYVDSRDAKEGRDEFLAEYLHSDENDPKVDPSAEAKLARWMIAAELGNINHIQRMIERGFDIMATDEDGDCAGHLAARKNQYEVLTILLDSGLDVNTEGYLKRSLLLAAANSSSYESMDLLIERGADISAVSKFGSGILHALTGPYSKDRFNRDYYLKLLDMGVPMVADKHGKNPLHQAVEEGYLDIVGPLLEAGCDVGGDEDGWTPVHKAIFKEHLELIEPLLAEGCDVNARARGRSILDSLFVHFSFGGKDEDPTKWIDLLVSHGCTIDARSFRHAPPSCWSHLIELGADVNSRYDDGGTPIGQAVLEADLEIVKLLLQHGADPNLLMPYGDERHSPLDSLDCRLDRLESEGADYNKELMADIRKALVDAGGANHSRS